MSMTTTYDPYDYDDDHLHLFMTTADGWLMGGVHYHVVRFGAYYGSAEDEYYIYSYYTPLELERFTALLADPSVPDLLMYNIDNTKQWFVVKQNGKPTYRCIDLEPSNVKGVKQVILRGVEDATAWLHRQEKLERLIEG